MIDSRAIVDPAAAVDDGVSIGPGCIVGAGVRIGAGTKIGPYTVITGPTSIGRDNDIHSFCSIGADPQDKKFGEDENSALEIGNGNTIREYCSINRGTSHGGGVTRIGDDNWIMAYCHVAHDCRLGDFNVLANTCNLAGHVEISNHVTLGGYTGVHQFCRVSDYAFSAISSVIVKDVPPFVLVEGNTARARGLNRVGLKRHGFSGEELANLKQAYRIFFRSGLSVEEALREIETELSDCNRARYFAEFIRSTERGVIR